MLGAARIDATRIRATAELVDSESVRDWHRLPHLAFPEAADRAEAHPVFLLAEIARHSAHAHDRLTSRIVAAESMRQLLALVAARERSTLDHELRATYNVFLPVLRAVVGSAVEYNDDITMEAALVSMLYVDELSAEHHVPWHCLIEFHGEISGFGSLAVRHGYHSAARAAFRGIAAAFKAHLQKNVPPEAEIWLLYPYEEVQDADIDHEKAIQWENVSDVYPNLLVELIEAAIDVGEREIVTSGMITLGSMCDDVANSVTLGVKQKGRILSVQLYNAQKLGVRALTQLDQPSSMVLYPLSASRSGKWLHVGDPWAKEALTHLCEAIISLAEIHRLQRYTINELGRIGRGLVRHVGDRELCAEALIVIARTLETVAAALAPPSSRGDMHLIRETVSQLASIQRWFVNNHVSAKAVETAVANSLSNIERVVTASATNSALHMVSWQDLTSMGSESTPDENI